MNLENDNGQIRTTVVDEEEQDDREDEYHYEDDDDYVYEGDSNNEDEGSAVSANVTSNYSEVGVKFNGDLVEHVADPRKNALYSVYRQLSQIFLVEISEDFYSASIFAMVFDKQLWATIEFPSVSPFFPASPPNVTLHTYFLAPNHHYNLIFNCHPIFSRLQWNPCANILQVFCDMLDAVRVSKVDGIVDYDSTVMKIVKMIKANDFDISGLFPANHFSYLPAFGVLHEKKSDTMKSSTGVGYSANSSSNLGWTINDESKEKNIKCLREIAASLSRNDGKEFKDQIIVDSIYFLLNKIVTFTLTLDEFFRNSKFYEEVLEFSLPLPKPSSHISSIRGFMFLYPLLTDMMDTFEPTEREVVNKIAAIIKKFDNSTSNSTGSSTVADGARSSEKNEKISFDKIVFAQSPFTDHRFLADSLNTKSLPARWFKKVKIELSTMRESLPSNLIVISGLEISQPNLMKILMFPEAQDTPYVGGCFVFHLFIPDDYPLSPPKCLLDTTGYNTFRFNPNLYKCGKVCLSLLGTWSGEPWNPEISNLTQVINSILFLIFVKDPYYNEPGYQNSANDLASNEYNKNIRTGTLKFAYLDHLKKPHPELSAFIIPLLKQNWLLTGRRIALEWLKDDQSLQAFISKIDEEVQKI